MIRRYCFLPQVIQKSAVKARETASVAVSYSEVSIALLLDRLGKGIMPIRFRALRCGPRGFAVGLRAGGVVRHRQCSPVAVPRLLS